MSDDAKNMLDITLNIIAMIGASIAFWISLNQWKRGQDWQRAEQMDKFVKEFEREELLRLAATAVDWTERKVVFKNREFVITNKDCLLALRDHRQMENPSFEGEQAILRDAYDSLLTFFARLELAISTKLIDIPPSKQYFHYWLSSFLSFEKHPDKTNILNNKTPQEMTAEYIHAYGNIDSIKRLCLFFGEKENVLSLNKITPKPIDNTMPA